MAVDRLVQERREAGRYGLGEPVDFLVGHWPGRPRAAHSTFVTHSVATGAPL